MDVKQKKESSDLSVGVWILHYLSPSQIVNLVTVKPMFRFTTGEGQYVVDNSHATQH